MAIVAPIVILVIGALITAIVNITGSVLANRSSTILLYNVQDALNRIEQDVSLSNKFLAINSVTLTSPQGYDNDTTAFNNVDETTGTMLVLEYPATTDNPINATDYVYANLPNSCGSNQVLQNQKVILNIVYFVKDGTLWRRVLANSDYATIGCSVPWQKPSCQPGITGSLCKAEDIRLVDGVTASDFTISYYTAAGQIIPQIGGGSAFDRQITLNAANTIEVSINATANSAGRNISQSGSVRASRYN